MGPHLETPPAHESEKSGSDGDQELGSVATWIRPRRLTRISGVTGLYW
jgi:hypothetical protein